MVDALSLIDSGVGGATMTGVELAMPRRWISRREILAGCLIGEGQWPSSPGWMIVFAASAGGAGHSRLRGCLALGLPIAVLMPRQLWVIAPRRSLLCSGQVGRLTG